MSEFVVTSERQTKLRFHSRRYQRDGSLASYVVTLEGHGFSATAQVGNPEEGVSPVRLFDEMIAMYAMGRRQIERPVSRDRYFRSGPSSDLQPRGGP